MDMNIELKKIILEECLNLGINTAHDYDGIETEEDLVIYTKAIINKYKKLINKSIETKVNCAAKHRANDEPSLEICSCHNFCKYDNIQFDTSLG